MDYLTVALKLLEIALQVAPELATFIRNMVDGSTDPVAVRISEILPSDSASRAAQKTLGG